MQNFSENNIFIKKNNNSSKAIKKLSNSVSSIFDELSNPIHRRINHRNNSSIQNKRFPQLKFTKSSKNKLISSYSLKHISLKTQHTFDIYSLRKVSTSQKRLFSILDKAEVKNKAVTYLKSGRERDIEDITGRKVKKYILLSND